MTHKNQGGKFGSFVLGLLIGAAGGVTWAMLKAPQSGEQTRKQFQQTTDELRQEADRIVSTARTHLQEAKAEISQHAADIQTEGESALEESKKSLKRGVQNVQEETEAA